MATANRNTLIGKRFGRLVVTGQCNATTGDQSRRWECLCDCGGDTRTTTRNLNSGHTQSCGCLHVERSTRHGLAKWKNRSLGYRAWNAMLQRCTNPKHIAYPSYGGSGITVCDRWRDFANFYEDMGPRPCGASIDRIDNLKGYAPDNCRWATWKEQSRNKRTNRLITHDGITACISEWADITGIHSCVIRSRLHIGWNVARALTEPIHKK